MAVWSIDDILKPIVTPPESPRPAGLRDARKRATPTLLPLPGDTPKRVCTSRLSYKGPGFSPRLQWDWTPTTPPCPLTLTPPPEPLSCAAALPTPTPPPPPPTPRPLQELSCNTRFTTPASLQELNSMCKPFVPKHTNSNTTWAVGVF